MTKRLYVGDLPDHVTDEILKNLFSTYGTVESVTVMINKITDLPHGFVLCLFRVDELGTLGIDERVRWERVADAG